MNKKNKKLRIKIKGRFSDAVYGFFARMKARRHGVLTKSITYHANDTIEVVLEGERTDLWKVLNWNKRGPVFCAVEEVSFKFIEA